MKLRLYTLALALLPAISFAQSLPDNPFGNSLVPDMIADASIEEIDGAFYCYATTDGYGRGLETSGPPVVWTSKDFVHWSFDGTYFPSARYEKYWAPSKAVPYKGRFFIYPTINGKMYAAVSDSPLGPFRLAEGADTFTEPAGPNTLLKKGHRDGIDAEIFIDDDGQPYIFWNRCHVAKLGKDLVTVDEESTQLIDIPHHKYSEGPVFFKRNGIYYYVYTLEGNEEYQYNYIYSRTSPLGPWIVPENDIVTFSDHATGVHGPGHGSIFKVEESGKYYFAFLEFGRGSTNRMTYVNELEFNADGTLKPVAVTMQGVGALKRVKTDKALKIKAVTASSTAEPKKVKPEREKDLVRIEHFVPGFATDGANGSRWMAAEGDSKPWIMADLGRVRKVRRSEVAFVRPTAGHAYVLEYSKDGKNFTQMASHPDPEMKSPHSDIIGLRCRYLRIKILEGVSGVWEWNIY